MSLQRLKGLSGLDFRPETSCGFGSHKYELTLFESGLDYVGEAQFKLSILWPPSLCMIKLCKRLQYILGHLFFLLNSFHSKIGNRTSIT